MIPKLKHLLLLIVLITSLPIHAHCDINTLKEETVNADFNAIILQYPTNDYSVTYAKYKLSEIATSLDTDATSLSAALADGTAMFGLFDADGILIKSTAGDNSSYYMALDGSVVGFGEKDCVAYNGAVKYNVLMDYFVIPIGQYPNSMHDGDSFSQVFTLKYNGKSTTIGVVLNIIPMPILDTPVTDLSQITIVTEIDATLDFIEGKAFEGKTVAIDASELLDALGVEQVPLAPILNLRDVTFTQEVVTDDDGGTVEFANTLVNEREATDGWFGRYSSFNTDEETFYLQNGLRSYDGNCTFYLQNPAIADGQFTMVYGQHPGTMAAGSEDYAVIYVVNGDKAVKITYTVNVHEAEKVDFASMTKAGEQTADGSLEVASSYTSVAVEVNVADILEKLGAESADELTGWLLADESSLADPTMTDYWQGEEGFAQAWVDNACCQVKVDLANGTANLLQMPRYTEIAEPQTFPLNYIFVKGDKYYQLKFNFTLTPVKQITGEKVCVSNEEFSMQIVPSPDTYIYGETYKLDVDYIENLIGTRNFTIYGDKWNAETETLDWNKQYTCYDGDEKGTGFWYGITTYENAEHQLVVDNEGFGQNSFGLYLNALGVITWVQFPGQRSVGDEYKAHIYIVNEDKGLYIDYLINVYYVEDTLNEMAAVTIQDNIKSYSNNSKHILQELKYTRTFNNTNYQALYVPFSMSYSDWSEDFDIYRINGFFEYDTDKDGKKDTAVLELMKVEEANGDLKPNYPYVIKAKEAGEKTITLTDATLYATEINSIDCSTVETKYTFTGTYSRMNGMKSAGYYALAGGELCPAEDDDVTLGAFRWYMSVQDRGSQFIPRNNNIKIRVYGEDDAANRIEGVEYVDSADDAIYTIDGRLVKSDSLRPGLYIKNGKKFFINK